MTRSIDARRLACPQPVILTKKAIEEGELVVEVLVDNDAARENVTRLAEKLGYEVSTKAEEGNFRILLARQGEAAKSEAKSLKSTLLFVSSDTIGQGSDELGAVLIKNFFYALTEGEEKPQTIVFMNSGVKLAAEGSPALESLQKLSSSGTEILLCGTCLDFFQLKEKVAVGNISNMYAILESFMKAEKVVTI